MADHAYITYEEFGRKFFEVAVSEDRVGDAIGSIAGDEFEMGPIAQGPGKIAKVTARVKIQKPRAASSAKPSRSPSGYRWRSTW